MIRIRANESEAELEGTVAELLTVRDGILDLVGSDALVASFQASPCSPQPYSHSLARLDVHRQAAECVVFVASEGVLRVDGSDDNLQIFASFLEFPDDTPTGSHAHFEPQPSDSYISPTSLPLVIGVRRAGT